MKILKFSIIAAHTLLGLYLIFMLNSPITIYSKVSNPENYWPDYSVSWIVPKTIRMTSANIVKGRAYIAHLLFFMKAIAPTIDNTPIIIPMIVSATIQDTE